MKLNKLALILAVAALACSALAQGGGGGRQRGQRGGSPYAPMTLVTREEVQKELNITDDQKAKITELRTATRQKSTDARTAAGDDRAAQQEAMAKVNMEAAKSLNEILKPEQAARLRELQIQWTGKAIVISDKEVQTALGLSDEQKTKLADLRTKQQAAMTELRNSTQGDQAAMREGMAKNAKIMEDEIDKVLTDGQKTKLTELGGKPLPKPAPAARGGGGG